MFNPSEEKFLHDIESSNLGERALLARAFQEIHTVLERDKVDPNDFRDIYDEDKITKDLAYVEDKKRIFTENATPESKEAKKLASVFEGIFHIGAHEHGWLGEGTHIIKTSDFDDWYSGVDGVVEFRKPKEEAQHLAVGIDVTYSTMFEEKFQKIKNDIKNGELPTIQYFRSGDIRDKLQKVPRVIVGAERSNLIRLCKDLFARPVDNEKLAKHPFQILQLKQIRLQLDAFAKYARVLGKVDIAEVYERDAEIIRRILQKKSVIEGLRMGEWENDRVFQAIKEELKKLEKEIEGLKKGL